MIKTETNLKCKGCSKDMPETEYNTVTGRPNWFGKYSCSVLVEWICIECWDKGVRYK